MKEEDRCCENCDTNNICPDSEANIKCRYWRGKGKEASTLENIRDYRSADCCATCKFAYYFETFTESGLVCRKKMEQLGIMGIMYDDHDAIRQIFRDGEEIDIEAYDRMVCDEYKYTSKTYTY